AEAADALRRPDDSLHPHLPAVRATELASGRGCRARRDPGGPDRSRPRGSTFWSRPPPGEDGRARAARLRPRLPDDSGAARTGPGVFSLTARTSSSYLLEKAPNIGNQQVGGVLGGVVAAPVVEVPGHDVLVVALGERPHRLEV